MLLHIYRNSDGQRGDGQIGWHAGHDHQMTNDKHNNTSFYFCLHSGNGWHGSLDINSSMNFVLSLEIILAGNGSKTLKQYQLRVSG